MLVRKPEASQSDLMLPLHLEGFSWRQWGQGRYSDSPVSTARMAEAVSAGMTSGQHLQACAGGTRGCALT